MLPLQDFNICYFVLTLPPSSPHCPHSLFVKILQRELDRTPDILPEYPGSSTHMVLPVTPVLGDLTPPMTSADTRHTQGSQT